MLTKEELRELVEKLKAIKGRHTELISVLIPAGYSLNSVGKQLEAEKNTATNIKSKTTQKNVIAALETIIRDMKLYDKTPENGMAFYCGNISEKEGQTDIQLFVLEPPVPLNTRLYRCDQEFVTEPLEEMLEVEEVYGLLVMDRKEATIGLLEGKQIKVLRKMTSGVPGKYKTGGQSSQRFERLREGAAKEFYRRVAEAMKELFFEMPKLKGILVGGPVPTKEDFLDEGQLVTVLREKIIAVKDIGNSDESGLEDLVNSASDELEKQEIVHEKKILERFFETLGKNPDKAVYGEENVRKVLEYGAADILILSKGLEKNTIKELTEKAGQTSTKLDIVSE
jgi:peptide chain release factor subunit 1